MNRFQPHALLRSGERLFQVGGAVRDRLLGREGADDDGVLLSSDPEGAAARLEEAGLAPVVGREGGKAWRGRGIDLTIWPWPQGQPLAQTLAEEALQRDLTLNALYTPWGEEEVIDPLGGGVEDVRRGVLRATGAGAFARDPVRVLRLARLASVLGFSVDPSTLNWAQAVDPAAAGERIGREVVQWLIGSPRPGQGLALWAQSGAIRVIPEVAALQGVAQREDYHPEGDVWVHTGQVLDRAASWRPDLGKSERTVLMLAALFHDSGKAAATRWEGGRWRAHGHEAISRDLTEARLGGWGLSKTIVDWSIRLVAEHGRPLALARDGAGWAAWWRLLDRHPCPELLYGLAQADSQGRLPPGREEEPPPLFEAGAPFAEALDRLGRIPPLSGQMLIDEGVRPGPDVGRGLSLLRQASFLGQWRDEEAVAPLLRRAGLLPGRRSEQSPSDTRSG